jgi:hypothetical protein
MDMTGKMHRQFSGQFKAGSCYEGERRETSVATARRGTGGRTQGTPGPVLTGCQLTDTNTARTMAHVLSRTVLVVCLFPSPVYGPPVCSHRLSTAHHGLSFLAAGTSGGHTVDQPVQDPDHLSARLHAVRRFRDVQGGLVTGPHEDVR